jgi:hypothetical protein
MMRRVSWSMACAMLVLVSGCRSAWIECTIVNDEKTPVSLVEVNYPGGSFGVQTIAAGGSYRYRFHALGTDTVSVDFTDAARQSHSVKGPELKQKQAGSLGVDILDGNRVNWNLKAAGRE